MREFLVSSVAAMQKVGRYASIYGPARTFYKASGRLRIGVPSFPSRQRSPRIIGVIGCGQFAYSTIAYFLSRAFGRSIAACYDVDPVARSSFARAMRVPKECSSVEELLSISGLDLVYIASNHSTHALYAAAALQKNIAVYVEKPIAVNRDQLLTLLLATRSAEAKVYAGYNRPFSGAVRLLRRHLQVDPGGGISLKCFVSGHQIAADHWYRAPNEGSRVCGNIGHWIDLFVHILAWRGLPDRMDISLAWADDCERDDNVSITIATDRHDLFSVMLTSRCEPFEGVNETIDFQHCNTICKIDDFRRITLWQGPRKLRRRFWPKDVGHRSCVLQPFGFVSGRDWQEVILSTLLMLHVADLVRAGVHTSTFSLADSLAGVTAHIAAKLPS